MKFPKLVPNHFHTSTQFSLKLCELPKFLLNFQNFNEWGQEWGKIRMKNSAVISTITRSNSVVLVQHSNKFHVVSRGFKHWFQSEFLQEKCHEILKYCPGNISVILEPRVHHYFIHSKSAQISQGIYSAWEYDMFKRFRLVFTQLHIPMWQITTTEDRKTKKQNQLPRD